MKINSGLYKQNNVYCISFELNRHANNKLVCLQCFECKFLAGPVHLKSQWAICLTISDGPKMIAVKFYIHILNAFYGNFK